jgi:ABC-type transport system involved in multi-copper enzyme maturation permease subunit
MSAVVVSPQATRAASAARASFSGLLRAELYKLAHLRITQVLAALYLVFVVGGQLLLASARNIGSQLAGDPLTAFHTTLEGDLSIVRMFTGVVMLILSAHAVGLEYTQGTIRVLLGRGVGRLQLLGAKMAALAVAATAFIATGLLIELVGAWLIVAANAGASHPLAALNGEFWTDAWYYLLCVLISAGVTLLLGVAAATVGRSLAFGLAVGLSWFAVDNLLVLPLTILAQFTHSHFWLSLSGFLLGPLLNRLPDHIVPAWHLVVRGPHGPVSVTQTTSGFGIIPPTPVDGRHALAVIAVYAAIFLAAALACTRGRDVLE